MSKRASQWEKFRLLLLAEAKTKNWNIAALLAQKFSPKITKSLSIAGIGVFWWYWNWKLLLATVVGIGLMWLVYTVQTHNWHKYRRIWQRLLTNYNRKLTLAISSGGMGAFTTYLVVSIWADAENQWLATGLILQGLATIVTLFLLGWYLWSNQTQKHETRFEQLSQDLTATEPLKRLIAIRQLNILVVTNTVPREYAIRLAEYYHLMLSQPQEPIVTEALLDGLEFFGISVTKEARQNPIQLPLNLVRSPNPVYK
ncbi:MAG TPA: ATP synthase subunit I [Xenococcaceae cyanobacterium]